jgi:hypothetical protein
VVRNATVTGNVAMGNGADQVVHGIIGGIGAVGTGVCFRCTFTGNIAFANQADGFDASLASSTFKGNKADGNNRMGLTNGGDYYLPATKNSTIKYH